MTSEQKLPGNIGLGITVGIVASAIIFVIVAWLFWQIPWPFPLTNFHQHLEYWSAMTINDLFSPLFENTADKYRYFLQNLQPPLSEFIVIGRFDIAIAIAIIAGTIVGYWVGKSQPAVRHVSGRKLIDGNDGMRTVKKQTVQEGKRTGNGLRLHEKFDWSISLDRECRHILIDGASGGGKTQLINAIIKAAIGRGDQLIIYDNKGDFTQWMPEAILLAPWDARSHALDISRDCHNAQQARELATHLIPAGHDPIWHQAARQILTALIIKLQIEKPDDWTWRDLHQLVCGSREVLLLVLQTYMPEAQSILEVPGKTTQSVLMHLSTNAWLIADLAKAWGNAPKDKQFSITEWIKNAANHQKKNLILQGSANFNELSNAYIQFVFNLATSLINSPEIPSSKERRLWFFLDEFPQLGKLEKFRVLLEIGRSKGIRVVLACQDISQIRETYGEHAANSWLGIVGTYIFTRMGSGESANFVAEKMVGHQTIDRTVPKGEELSAPIREKRLVIEPSELSEKLGPDKNGVNVMLLGFRDAIILNWPYTDTKKIREASVLAKWLNHPATSSTKPSQVSLADNNSLADSKAHNDQPVKSRITLRRPTPNQLLDMASSGTNIEEAGEAIDDMSVDVMGGRHESR